MPRIKANIKTVLIRVDYNVPVINGKAVDLTRIRESLPTIQFCLQKKFKIVLMSHFGRPQNKDKKYSLKIIVKHLEDLLNQEVLFVENGISKETQKRLVETASHQVILLENLRFYDGETQNSPDFAKSLSLFGDIYINDAFGASHRQHASVSAIQKFFIKKQYKGLLLERELIELTKIKHAPIKPYTIIVGGSKIGSKINLLKAFLGVADNILIGGGMAFPFIKHMGGDIGKSICKEGELSVVAQFLNQSKTTKTKIMLPKDVIITKNIGVSTNTQSSPSTRIPKEYMGVDIGQRTRELFEKIIRQSKTIMWNGPMGISEIDSFSLGTKSVATAIVEATSKNKTYSLIGGGDTISEISKLGLQDKFSYTSTGGGAMLEFFKENGLPETKNLLPISKLTQ